MSPYLEGLRIYLLRRGFWWITLKMSNLNKIAFVAYSWKEYSEQGEQYLKLEQWWRANSYKISEEYDSSYNSWTRWYNEHF